MKMQHHQPTREEARKAMERINAYMLTWEREFHLPDGTTFRSLYSGRKVSKLLYLCTSSRCAQIWYVSFYEDERGHIDPVVLEILPERIVTHGDNYSFASEDLTAQGGNDR